MIFFQDNPTAVQCMVVKARQFMGEQNPLGKDTTGPGINSCKNSIIAGESQNENSAKASVQIAQDNADFQQYLILEERPLHPPPTNLQRPRYEYILHLSTCHGSHILGRLQPSQSRVDCKASLPRSICTCHLDKLRPRQGNRQGWHLAAWLSPWLFHR